MSTEELPEVTKIMSNGTLWYVFYIDDGVECYWFKSGSEVKDELDAYMQLCRRWNTPEFKKYRKIRREEAISAPDWVPLRKKYALG